MQQMPKKKTLPSGNYFGAKLEIWRTAAGWSQIRLEREVGKTKSWVSRLESGAITPPDKETCLRIGEALGVEGELIWRAAAKDRLRGFDEDLLEYLQEASEYRITERERYLLEALRHIEEKENQPGLIDQVSEQLEAIAYVETPGPGYTECPRAYLVRMIRAFGSLVGSAAEWFLSTMAVLAEALSKKPFFPSSTKK